MNNSNENIFLKDSINIFIKNKYKKPWLEDLFFLVTHKFIEMLKLDGNMNRSYKEVTVVVSYEEYKKLLSISKVDTNKLKFAFSELQKMSLQLLNVNKSETYRYIQYFPCIEIDTKDESISILVSEYLINSINQDIQLFSSVEPYDLAKLKTSGTKEMYRLLKYLTNIGISSTSVQKESESNDRNSISNLAKTVAIGSMFSVVGGTFAVALGLGAVTNVLNMSKSNVTRIQESTLAMIDELKKSGIFDSLKLDIKKEGRKILGYEIIWKFKDNSIHIDESKVNILRNTFATLDLSKSENKLAFVNLWDSLQLSEGLTEMQAVEEQGKIINVLILEKNGEK